MTFLPRAEVLSLEELYDIVAAFVHCGGKKIRITGGEPLIRKDVLSLIRRIGALNLEELVITTNGARLAEHAEQLKAAGVSRINISIDSLDHERFRRLTRFGELSDVLAGIEAAIQAGFERIRLNSVILKGYNDQDVLSLVAFARRKQIDISFIEEMPLGEIDDHQRSQVYISTDELFEQIHRHYPLTTTDFSTGGPSTYYKMQDSSSLVGFISPHSHNFCHLCNRIRLTVEGRLLLCLGNEHSMDLRAIVRSREYLDSQAGERLAMLSSAIRSALPLKPKQHEFSVAEDAPQLVRFMSMTGG